LLATLESYRLAAQMNKRFILAQTLKVTLPGLLQRLSDNVLYVGVCVSTKPMKSIPERVCHVHHYRRPSRECTGLAPARLWTLGGKRLKILLPAVIFVDSGANNRLSIK
jgi:hypothetical protein